MNKSMLIIIGGALVVAMIVAVIVQMSLGGKKKGDVPGSEVLVASKTLLNGEIIKVENTRWVTFPDNAMYKGMIKKKDQVEGKKAEVFDKPLRRVVESGEPITTQAVVTNAKSGNYLSASIAPGMRAMAIPVKADTLAGGFIAQGDYVDVIMTWQVGTLKGGASKYAISQVQKHASETVLSNVRVLALDQNAKEGDHAPKTGRTITLEVSKEQAQTLAMAAKMGSLTLALRRLGEKDTVADKDVSTTTDVKAVGLIKKVYKLMDKSEMGSNTVRLYNGASVVNLPVRAIEEDTVVK